MTYRHASHSGVKEASGVGIFWCWLAPVFSVIIDEGFACWLVCPAYESRRVMGMNTCALVQF